MYGLLPTPSGRVRPTARPLGDAEGATAPGNSQASGPLGRGNAGERVVKTPPKGKTARSGQSLRFHDSAGRHTRRA